MNGSDREPTAGRADAARSTRSVRARVTASATAGWQRFEGSAAGSFRRRLTELDVVNRGMLFAAIQLLCLFPFVIIARSLIGQSTTADTVERFGLNHDAAAALTKTFVPPSSTSNALTGLSYVFFALSGLAVAGAFQELYERAFDIPGRGMRDTPRRLIWLIAYAAAGFLVGAVSPWMHDSGGPVLYGAFTLIGATCFWWFSMWLLLGGHLTWRELFPSALATGVCWLGMIIVFRLTLSKTIITDYRKYGAAGVVLALVSVLVAVGVVIILGAVIGLAWRERGTRAPGSAAVEPSGSESAPPE